MASLSEVAVVVTAFWLVVVVTAFWLAGGETEWARGSPAAGPSWSVVERQLGQQSFQLHPLVGSLGDPVVGLTDPL